MWFLRRCFNDFRVSWRGPSPAAAAHALTVSRAGAVVPHTECFASQKAMVEPALAMRQGRRRARGRACVIRGAMACACLAKGAALPVSCSLCCSALAQTQAASARGAV